jgi:hypothetical protein
MGGAEKAFFSWYGTESVEPEEDKKMELQFICINGLLPNPLLLKMPNPNPPVAAITVGAPVANGR